jgi:hypothetical protein
MMLRFWSEPYGPTTCLKLKSALRNTGIVFRYVLLPILHLHQYYTSSSRPFQTQVKSSRSEWNWKQRLKFRAAELHYLPHSMHYRFPVLFLFWGREPLTCPRGADGRPGPGKEMGYYIEFTKILPPTFSVPLSLPNPVTISLSISD